MCNLLKMNITRSASIDPGSLFHTSYTIRHLCTHVWLCLYREMVCIVHGDLRFLILNCLLFHSPLSPVSSPTTPSLPTKTPSLSRSRAEGHLFYASLNQVSIHELKMGNDFDKKICSSRHAGGSCRILWRMICDLHDLFIRIRGGTGACRGGYGIKTQRMEMGLNAKT